MIKNSIRMTIYQQKLLLTYFQNKNFKSTIFLYKNDNFPKIAIFRKLI